MTAVDATTERARRLADENHVLRCRIEQLEQALVDTVPLPPEWGLTATERAVFGVLVNRPLATRGATMAAVHRDPTKEEPLPKNVDVQIYKLRRKLRSHGIVIATVVGVGYQLAAPVRQHFNPQRGTLRTAEVVHG